MAAKAAMSRNGNTVVQLHSETCASIFKHIHKHHRQNTQKIVYNRIYNRAAKKLHLMLSARPLHITYFCCCWWCCALRCVFFSSCFVQWAAQFNVHWNIIQFGVIESASASSSYKLRNAIEGILGILTLRKQRQAERALKRLQPESYGMYAAAATATTTTATACSNSKSVHKTGNCVNVQWRRCISSAFVSDTCVWYTMRHDFAQPHLHRGLFSLSLPLYLCPSFAVTRSGNRCY